MTGQSSAARVDGQVAASGIDDGGFRGADAERAIAVSDAACEALLSEIASLDAEHGGSGAPAASVQRLVLRSLPDVCSLLASHLEELPPLSAGQVLDQLFSRPPFSDRRMRSWGPRLRAHLDAYAESLTRWEGWKAHIVEIDDCGGDVAVRWVTAWQREADGTVAADLVGYVNDPADLARPNRHFAAFARDADAVYQRLVDEYGSPRFKGLRLWIVGADDQPVVRWQTTHSALLPTENQG